MQTILPEYMTLFLGVNICPAKCDKYRVLRMIIITNCPDSRLEPGRISCAALTLFSLGNRLLIN